MDGRDLGSVRLQDADNNDWEDLTSFEFDQEPHLMVAEIGDNDAAFDHRSLYFVREPDTEHGDSVTAAWVVRYRYPDGPRDAESAALDVPANRALILSKRDVPPRLYAVPIAGTDEMVTAEYLGTVHSLTQPTRQDIEIAPKTKDWWWQPVGMDISDDQRAAVIVTYRAVYYYRREANQSWLDALNSAPTVVGLGGLENAESVAFADNARTVVVTGENKHSAILLVDLKGAQ